VGWAWNDNGSYLVKVVTMRSRVLIVMTAMVLFAGTSDAGIILPADLRSGDPCRLISVTAGTHDATSGAAADYNQFVTEQSGQNPLLPSVTWSTHGEQPE
jgi:hypothetical protein